MEAVQIVNKAPAEKAGPNFPTIAVIFRAKMSHYTLAVLFNFGGQWLIVCKSLRLAQSVDSTAENTPTVEKVADPPEC